MTIKLSTLTGTATAALLVALVSSTASAWNHTGWVWRSDAFLVVWYMSDYVTPQLDEEFQMEVMVESINAWNRVMMASGEQPPPIDD